MHITFLGLTFHAYGLIIGTAISMALLIIESKAKSYSFPENTFWNAVMVVISFGMLGARLYHVCTDWEMYRVNVWLIPQVWNGGLSIIGGIIGGVLGLLLVSKTTHQASPRTFWTLADLIAFGLPIGQAVGRIANFINQELYGLPTTLPWAVRISPEHRVPEYKEFAFFHPLFAYEALGMLLFAFMLWKIERKKMWMVGDGKYALLYIGFYSILRAGLDFLRIEKTYFMSTPLGFNQVLLSVTGVVALMFLLRKLKMNKKLLHALFVVLAMFTISSCVPQRASSVDHQPTHTIASVKDHQKVEMLIQRQSDATPLKIQVEVVRSQQSHQAGLSQRAEIGSDGMLFLFPQHGKHQFWMKDMKFDLDMIWILDGEVKAITTNVRHPPVGSNSPEHLQLYEPPQPVNQVLEVPAGVAEKWQLQVGDKIVFP